MADDAFKKLDSPIAPLVLATVRRQGGGRISPVDDPVEGSLAISWSNPLVATLTAPGLLLLCWPVIAAGLRTLVPVLQPADAFED